MKEHMMPTLCGIGYSISEVMFSSYEEYSQRQIPLRYKITIRTKQENGVAAASPMYAVPRTLCATSSSSAAPTESYWMDAMIRDATDAV
jgi:hypothetical protein